MAEDNVLMEFISKVNTNLNNFSDSKYSAFHKKNVEKRYYKKFNYGHQQDLDKKLQKVYFTLSDYFNHI